MINSICLCPWLNLQFETMSDLRMLTSLGSDLFKHLDLPLCVVLKIRTELQKLPSTSGNEL